MDIFIQRLPPQATRREVEQGMKRFLDPFGITTFFLDKRQGSTFGNLSILETSAARLFLGQHGVPRGSPRSVLPLRPIVWRGQTLVFMQDRHDISNHAVQALQHQAFQRAAERAKPEKPTPTSSFGIRSLKCGMWDYAGDNLAFTPYYEDRNRGYVVFGTQQILVLLHGTHAGEQRIYCQYHTVQDVVLGSYESPTITVKLHVAPKFYAEKDEDDLAAAMAALTVAGGSESDAKKKLRVTSLCNAHSKVVGTCFVYQMTLENRFEVSAVRSLLSRNPRVPPSTTLGVPVMHAPQALEASFRLLENDLTDQRRYGFLPFSLLFQISALAKNGGGLHPQKVRELVPKISEIFHTRGTRTALAAMRSFATQIPSAGPGVEANRLSVLVLKDDLDKFAEDYEHYRYDPEDPYQLAERYAHINLIHKIVVTPTGIYLQGPYPEPTNRVLRKYVDHIDYFVRMVFQDEDGSNVRYDPRADQKKIYDHFKTVIEGTVLVAGRPFSFLGFSHSSLRAQSVWCMSPFFDAGTLQLPEHILRALGDFSNIRVPAKCAARIGQNFTDTNATIEIDSGDVRSLPMIRRNGRDFGDGVGTISRELLQLIWQVYGTRRALKPTALQIRYRGYKGMVSLDSRLQGQRLLLRDNMKKFEATSSLRHLEICGAGFRPLPMILNRQLIKILEDLGIAIDVFMKLQTIAVDELRLMTSSSVNTAHFLEQADTARATRVPGLIRTLGHIGLDYRQDYFLNRVVEMIVVTKLRDIKYRGRIPVKDGVTLYGIMDETGYLGANEIYVTTESAPEGGRWELVKKNVIVTRSPTMHPGDVQLVNAVNVPRDSPLKKLHNVVVFSQHGDRDIPNMLSGGDLDGDLYNVIWDEALIPRRTHVPADYPRVSAVELDRAVTRKDMSDFFVKFMQTDQLGMLSNIHLQLADQRDFGTLDAGCKQLAHMASVAVDFSKTGIPVDMKECPKHDRIRPDFMAPSPRVFTDERGPLQFEEAMQEDHALQDLEVEVAPTRYYRSTKALGHLYRAIDEEQFLESMQQESEALLLAAASSATMPEKLLAYMLRQARQCGIYYDHHKELAVEIRAGYEDSLVNLLHQYGPSSHLPATEYEAFAGCILGRKGGAQGKPLRELSKNLREQFESVCDYTVMRIVKGDEQMRGVTDLDLLYEDEGLDREVEALPRAIACLENAVQKEGKSDRRLGELQSFTYIAAGVCLRELERYRLTTFGSSILLRL